MRLFRVLLTILGLATGADFASASATTNSPDTHWSFQPVRTPALPTVQDARWIQTPLDSFILQKIEAKGLKPAAPASRETLIRRATFDLIGLPPTPGEIDAFLNDSSRNAFARVIDRLLASPQYGERWARHWLDVVRYTDSLDSRGIGGEGDIAEAYRYRDWAVQAFNRNLPYDQFVIDQIAGDILATNSPGRFDADKIIATGVYVIGEWGTGDADKEKMLTDIIDDQIDVTTRAFLGLTVACARCHDHKFDPISTRDYYALAGIFFSSHILPNPGVKTAGSPVKRVPLLSPAEAAARKAREARIKILETDIEQTLDANIRKAFNAMLTSTNLTPAILDRWKEFARADSTLLTKLNRNIRDKPGLHGLQKPDGSDTPSVVVNSTENEASFLTITMPPRTVALHPGPKDAIALGWRSPVTGSVRLRGELADADDKCGNGVEWTLTVRSSNAITKVASGAFQNGGKGSLSAVAQIGAGDDIQLAILPNANHSCDTTLVDLEITEEGGLSRAWDFKRELVPDLRNPSGPWRIYEVAAKRDELGPLNWKALHDTNSKPYAILSDPRSEFWAPLRSGESFLSPGLAAVRSELADLKSKPPPVVPVVHALGEGGTPQSAYPAIQDVHVHMRGRYDRLAEVVPRGFPEVLSREGERPREPLTGSGRLQLANWIASETHPLTARVMVNRLWHHHFGEGLVRTPNNYGKLGQPPTHPELLDYLATEFIRSGWSIKAMHRLMMLSATYQQSTAASDADPENELWARMSRKRLESEAIRDQLLAVGGKLDASLGGKSVRDFNSRRRTLYVTTVRSDRTTYQFLFDAADPNNIAEKRIASTVAPQALYLLNNPFVLQQAENLMTRLQTEAPAGRDERVNWLYRLLFARPPSEKEVQLARRTVDDFAAAGWTAYCHSLLCGNEFIFVD